MAKKELRLTKQLNFVLIYNFLIKGTSAVVFDIYVFANINFIRKKERK